MERMVGKVAVVTGGASGMGAGTARVLASEGAAVIILDASAKGEAVVETIIKEGGLASFYQVDVQDSSALKQIIAKVVARYQKIDALVNAAAIGPQATFLKSDGDFVDKVMGINFKGVWNVCQAVIPHMADKQYGRIVNYASVTGVLVVDPAMTAYAATKGAIMALTKALAVEFAPQGITVNAILPGVVDTPMLRNSVAEANPEDPESVLKNLAATVPIGRLGTPEEAGKVALFLCSDDSSYITGTSIVFDGGSTIPESSGSGWQPQE